MWWLVLLLTWCLTLTKADVCPQYCHCYTELETFMTANCSTSALTSNAHGANIDVLNLQPQHRSYHTRLTSRIFKNFRTIKFLNMSNMTLKHLPNDVFYGLHNVIEIDLTYNKIKHLNGIVFKDLESLNTLFLRGNPLELTSWDSIISKNLRELDLGYCGLTEIPTDTFANVGSLTHLSLDGNFLLTLTYNSLPSGLKYLNLANNKISNVPTDVLTSLRYLNRLDISGNPINCTCHLLLMQDWLSGQGKFFENDAACATPLQYAGIKLNDVDENHLCKMEIAHKERHLSNSIKHFRDVKPMRKLNMINDNIGLQGDQPFSDVDEYSRNINAEVMFTNDNTKRMGTHMEHLNHFEKESDEKHETMSNEKSTTSMEAGDGDKELGLGSSEMSDPSQDLAKTDGFDLHTASTDVTHEDTSNTEDTSDHDSTVDSEKEVTGEIEDDRDHENDESKVTDVKDIATSITPESKENEDEDKFKHNSPAMESLSVNSVSTSDYSNNIHALNTGNYTSAMYVNTEEDDNTETTDSRNEDFEDTDFTVTDEEATTKYSLIPTDSNEFGDEGYDTDSTDAETTEGNTSDAEVVSDLPSSIETMSKYTDSETQVFNDTESTMQESEDMTELTTHHSESMFSWPSTVTENPDYSYDTQHDDYTSPEEHYTTEASYAPSEQTSSEATSTSEQFTDDLYEGSGDGNVTLDTSTTYSWMEEQENETTSENYTVLNVTEIFPETEESTTYNSITTQDKFESTTIPDEFSTTEKLMTESDMSFSTETFILSSSTESSSFYVTTESSTESPSSSSIPFIGFHEEGEEEDEETTTPIAEGTVTISLSSSPTTFEYESTTEATSPVPVEETELVKKVATNDVKEKLIVPSSNEGFSKESAEEQPLESIAVYLIAGLIVVLVVLLVFVTLCRRKRNVKVRLPADTEANLGTEMQDMLLPKPPENGIKVIPKNYTNGNATNGKPEQKEEETPVLSVPEPEPEPDWEDKLGPIEAVTARLSVLARPQTPIFIHKSLN